MAQRESVAGRVHRQSTLDQLQGFNARRKVRAGFKSAWFAAGLMASLKSAKAGGGVPAAVASPTVAAVTSPKAGGVIMAPVTAPKAGPVSAPKAVGSAVARTNSFTNSAIFKAAAVSAVSAVRPKPTSQDTLVGTGAHSCVGEKRAGREGKWT